MVDISPQLMERSKSLCFPDRHYPNREDVWIEDGGVKATSVDIEADR